MSISLSAIRKSVATVTIASMVAFSIPAGFASAISTATLFPDGQGTYTSWQNTESQIDETGTPDCGSGDAISESTTGDRESVDIDLSSVPNGATIVSVDVVVYDRGDSVSGGTYQTFTRLNSTNLDSGSNLSATGGSGDPCSSEKSQNIDVPDTVKSGGTTLEVGVIKTSSNSNTVRVGAIRAIVNYTVVTYAINASAGANGSISPSGTVNVNEGNDQAFTIAPNAGYIVSDVLVDAVSQGQINEYEFSNVSAAHTISSTFENGWTAPTDDENNDGVSNPGNAYTSNNSYAVFNSDGEDVDYDEFGLSIPNGATIDGIEVAVEGNRTNNRTLLISLSSNNGSTYTSGAGSKTVNFTSTDSTVVVGGPTDLWDRSWTAAELNDTFDFHVRVDEGGESGDVNLDQIQVKVYYTENQAPVATDVNESTDEDNAVIITLTASDPESDPMTFATTSNPTNGTLSPISGNQVTYTPNANYFGADSFGFIANDGVLDSNAGTVNITVDALNDAPNGNDDAYSTDEDVTLNVSAPGVLDNDTDVENNSLTAVLVTDVSNGTLTLNSDGSFSYEPNANFTGVDSFTYTPNDADTGSTATVEITVDNTNDVPTAVADSYATPEDTQLDVLVGDGVLDNDSDLDGQTLEVTVQDDVTNGMLTLNADGSFTYTPDLDFNGIDSFTYIACETTAPNACSGEAVVEIEVGVVNDDPVLDPISNPTVVYGETPVTFTASASDTDSGTLTYSLSGEPAGATIDSSTGEFSWDTTGISPSMHPFDVIVEDGEGGSDSQSVTITINKASTTVSITNATDLMSGPSESTGSYEVKWSVSVEDPGAGIPTGMVVITGLSGATCSAAVEVGKCDLNSPVGTEEITAEYLGDTNFNGSMSSTVEHDLVDSTPGSGGPGGGGNGPILGGPGAVLGASIGPSGVGAPQGQVLGEATSTVSTSTPETTDTTPPACSALITKVPMSQGRPSNDPAQVSALQTFLNKELGTSLAVNGTFDAATTLAVNAFQLKYSTDILAPWGLTEPTGIVYLLSQWKINMIECPSLNLPRPSVN